QVTGLIGFGGEGKSSLARRWLDDLLADRTQPQPDGVFWWSFDVNPNVDEFFESALAYMTRGRIAPSEVPSASMRAQIIAQMLGARRYLFILDGLEALQRQEGDQYGLLTSSDLREFLGYFATLGHKSFCLITSRAPLLDLLSASTFRERAVDRLSPDDGRALLRRLGVQGKDAALDEVAQAWGGHALTLTLLATYLRDLWGGNAEHIGNLPAPTADETRYERVRRVLRRYDEHLSEAECAFLTLFSVFRRPVSENAFEMVFRAKTDAGDLNAPIAVLDDAAFADILKRLCDHRILRYDPPTRYYTAHPLIRAHYNARFTDSSGAQIQATHERIKDYYLFLVDNLPYSDRTERSMAPGIEAVHHACCAGDYDKALELYIHIFRPLPEWGNILHDWGAFETDLEVMQEFFPKGDLSRDPQVSDDRYKRFILNEVGLCLMNLGRLHEAKPIIVRMGYLARSELPAYLGELADSANTAHEALLLVRGIEPVYNECDALCSQAWAAHLKGDLEAAVAAFKEAEALKR